MFKCDQLIYIQLQKTGCTHIAYLLRTLFNGKQIGKHNAATKKQIATTPYVISSIRNPWDWYLSLWTYGVEAKGALMNRLTQQNFKSCLKSIAAEPQTPYKALLNEINKDPTPWREVYDRTDNVASFRKWLKLVHDPTNSHLLGEGYGNTMITDICGFMSYRYLYLCCERIKDLRTPGIIRNYSDLARFENQNCYIDFFVRQESLEDSFCAAIEKVRQLTNEEKQRIYASKRTNASKRALSIADYYDNETIELVGRREKLIIDKFGYLSP